MFLSFSETWINNETVDICKLKGYISIHNYRKTKQGGGVGVYISDEISFTVLNNLTHSSKHLESIFVRIDKRELNRCKDIIIGCMYRPPSGGCNIFLETCQEVP